MKTTMSRTGRTGMVRGIWASACCIWAWGPDSPTSGEPLPGVDRACSISSGRTSTPLRRMGRALMGVFFFFKDISLVWGLATQKGGSGAALPN